MFFGRNKELEKLNEIYESNKFEFAIIYGRRRVGKRHLSKNFVRIKNQFIFFHGKHPARLI